MTNLDVERLIKGFENDPRLKEFLMSKVKAPSPRQKQKEEVKYKYTSIDVPVLHIYSCLLCGALHEITHIVRITKGEICSKSNEEAVAELAKNPRVKRLPFKVLSCHSCKDRLMAAPQEELVTKVLELMDSLKIPKNKGLISSLDINRYVAAKKGDEDYDQERL